MPKLVDSLDIKKYFFVGLPSLYYRLFLILTFPIHLLLKVSFGGQYKSMGGHWGQILQWSNEVGTIL